MSKSQHSRTNKPAMRAEGESARPTAEQQPLHPVLQMQQQIGNAQIARLVAQRGPAVALPEVGLAGGPISNHLMARIQTQRGRGAPLDQASRSRMEQHLGATLDGVRVHTGAEAGALSRSISAQAFTIGSDIFFHQPADARDEQLLAHELTHVVQQRAMDESGPLRVGPANDRAEREAREVAQNPAGGKTADLQLSGNTIAREEESTFSRWLNTMTNPIAGGALSFLGAGGEGATGALGAMGQMASGAGAVLGPLGMLAGGMQISDAVNRPGTFGLDDLTDVVLGGAGTIGGAASTVGGLAALTGAGAGTTLGGAAAVANPVGAVIGAGLAGFGAGRLLDEGVGAAGRAITGDEQGDYTISGGLADRMTSADQALTSLWADPDRPAYQQTIGWQLAEALPSWLQ